MKEEIEELIKRVCERWDFYKSKESSEKGEYSDNSRTKTLNGYTTAWNNPNLLWLLVDIEEGGYEGSGSQVGLTKDGKLKWEYQSHCSCDDFADTNGYGDGELALDAKDEVKSYELSKLPTEWQKIVKVNLEEILKIQE